MMLMLGDHSASFPVRTHPVAEEEAAADEDEPVLASKYLLTYLPVLADRPLICLPHKTWLVRFV